LFGVSQHTFVAINKIYDDDTMTRGMNILAEEKKKKTIDKKHKTSGKRMSEKQDEIQEFIFRHENSELRAEKEKGINKIGYVVYGKKSREELWREYKEEYGADAVSHGTFWSQGEVKE
jgi:hypothetical protein